jgi:hypothetical protein
VSRARRPVESAPESVVDPERRYRLLGWYGTATEPDTQGGRMHEAIVRECARLDRKGGPIEERLTALRSFLDKHGWRDDAEGFVDRLDAARAAGWAPNRAQKRVTKKAATRARKR